MRELKACGYARVMFVRGAGGKFAGKEIVIFERPELNGSVQQRKVRQTEIPLSYPISDNEYGRENEALGGSLSHTISDKRQAIACQLTVQAPETQPTTGDRPAAAGFLEEQIGRLERMVGLETVQPYLGWWRKNAGKSRDHANALRQALDDCKTNRRPIRSPYRWIVKTFKNKTRMLNAQC